MNPTTASVTCPACGQAFLSMQNEMAGMTQCPHCAHSAPRAHFGTHSQVMGVTQSRRQMTHPQPSQHLMPGEHTTPPQPAVWPAAPPVTQPAAAVPPTSIARATLQPSQALMPFGAPTPASAGEPVMPAHMRGSLWKQAAFIVAFLTVCAASLWVWWDHANAPAGMPKPVGQSPPDLATKLEVKPLAASAIFIKTEPPDMAAITADVKTLVTELFAADRPERRAACVHDAAKHAAEIEGLFGAPAEKKIELQLLARIPGFPQALPGGQQVPLFKLVSSKCKQGSLVRLETGEDGKRRIHWPLFFETHEARLQQFLQNASVDESAWFHVGLRRSHGLDIPAELRQKYLTFDVQVAAGSDPHFVACVDRDSPLGRFMDRETEWGKACLARLLVRRLDIQADAPCFVVLDCEGAVEGGSGK